MALVFRLNCTKYEILSPVFHNNCFTLFVKDMKSADLTFKTVDENSKLPLVNIFGGKITTYRKLAEKVLNELKPYLSIKKKWTQYSKLPGGNFEVHDFTKLVDELSKKYNFLDRKWANRLIRAYGTEAKDILGESESLSDLGENFGWNLTEKEVLWLMENEWAETVDDILWRRSKIGLRLDKNEVNKLELFLNKKTHLQSPT